MQQPVEWAVWSSRAESGHQPSGSSSSPDILRRLRVFRSQDPNCAMDRQCRSRVVCRSTWAGRNRGCRLTSQQEREELESLTEVCPSIAQSTDCLRPRDFARSLTRKFRMSATYNGPLHSLPGQSHLALLQQRCRVCVMGQANRLSNVQPAPTATKISRASSLEAICWNSASSR